MRVASFNQMNLTEGKAQALVIAKRAYQMFIKENLDRDIHQPMNYNQQYQEKKKRRLDPLHRSHDL
jgi:hypothetical protein